MSVFNQGSNTSVKGTAVMGDHTNMMITPSAFV